MNEYESDEECCRRSLMIEWLNESMNEEMKMFNDLMNKWMKKIEDELFNEWMKMYLMIE